MRGRKPQPTSLKVLNGNPGKRPLNDLEPTPEAKLPKPPKHLSKIARRAWLEMSKRLDDCGITSKIDGVAFQLLCEAYGNYLEACEKVAAHGAVWLDKGEGKIPKFAYSPYWAIMNREWEKVKQMLVEFGMTPSSRARVKKVLDHDSARPLEAKYFDAV